MLRVAGCFLFGTFVGLNGCKLTATCVVLSFWSSGLPLLAGFGVIAGSGSADCLLLAGFPGFVISSC